MHNLSRSKRHKVILSLMLVFILTLGSFSSFADVLKINQRNDMLLNQKVSKEVFDRFDSGNEKVEVLIELKENADTKSILDSNEIKFQNTNLTNSQIKLENREAVIDELERTAKRSQKGILNYIQLQSKYGKVGEYQSFYIVNMVFLEASQDVINNIALRDEVKHVYFNEKIYLNDYTVDSKGDIEIIEEIDIKENLETTNSIKTEGEKTSVNGGITVLKDNVTTQAIPSANIEWNIKQVNADKVWDTYNIDGTGVVIGMIDTGVQWDHPALKDKYMGYNQASGRVNHSASWYDAQNKRTTPYDDTQTPHGTHCMGTILGQEPSGKNAIGVAPGAKFIVAKALGANGGTSAQLLDAGQWMLKPGGSAANAPDIISNSWGGGNGINDWYRNMVKSWRAAGIVPVFAAGNATSSQAAVAGSISVPSNYPESFAVGATDINNNRGSFSLLGPSPYDRNIPKPDIAAPGVNIRSSVPNGYEGGWNGTSMACPNVAGVAALIFEANPNLTVAQVENVIKNTARPLTDSSYRTSPNMAYGYGLVNALEAVKSIKGSTPDPEPEPITEGSLTGKIKNLKTDAPIVNANVVINNTRFTTTTNYSGDYTINNIPAGTYTVTVTANGYKEISGTVSITANQVTTANGTMEPVEEEPVYTGTITGTVTNKDTNRAISGVKVTIGDTSLSTTTDFSGKYTINNVPVGTHLVKMTAPGYLDASGNITISANRTTTANGTMTPRPAPIQTGQVTGRVVNSYRNVGVSGARVSITGTSLYTYTDSYGYFTLNDVPAGLQEIYISRSGYYNTYGNITVTGGRRINLNITLRPYSYFNLPGDEDNRDIEITPSPIDINPPGIKNPIIELPIISPPKYNK